MIFCVLLICLVENKDERCDKVLLYWSPEVCASEAGIEEPAVPVVSATTHVRGHYFITRST